MTIKQIQARFTSGNAIPVDKAIVPASEWAEAMDEIESLRKRYADLQVAAQLALDALGPEPPECCGCQEEWRIAIDALNGVIGGT